jgi:protein required for attachment to host cells
MPPDPERRRTWTLAINAARARILPSPDLPGAEEIVIETTVHRPQDVMSDRRGRSFPPRAGDRRVAVEPGSDPLEKETREYLQKVLAALEGRRTADELRHLGVFADPTTLGHLREMWEPPLRDLILFESAKNIVDLDAGEIRRRAEDEMKAG